MRFTKIIKNVKTVFNIYGLSIVLVVCCLVVGSSVFLLSLLSVLLVTYCLGFLLSRCYHGCLLSLFYQLDVSIRWLYCYSFISFVLIDCHCSPTTFYLLYCNFLTQANRHTCNCLSV